LFELAGAALIVYAAWLVVPALGFATAGVIAFGVAIYLERSDDAVPDAIEGEDEQSQ
jgi:hypothetical protein